MIRGAPAFSGPVSLDLCGCTQCWRGFPPEWPAAAIRFEVHSRGVVSNAVTVPVGPLTPAPQEADPPPGRVRQVAAAVHHNAGKVKL